MKFLARSTLTLALAAAASFSHAGLFDDDEARKAILDLRAKVEANRQATDAASAKLAEDLRRQVAQSSEEIKKLQDDNTALKRSILDLANQIEAQKADNQRLRGQFEQLSRDVAELQRKQKDVVQSLDERVRKFEPVKVQHEGREFMADPAEKTAFDAALAVFRTGDFAGAATAFGDFLRRYAQSGYAASANFWLGNAEYANKDYKESIAAFRELLRIAPDSARASEAMLSIANCQIEMRDTKAARVTLAEITTKYPGTEAAQVAKDRLTKLK
jgi:tol-pal system protein YbgF